MDTFIRTVSNLSRLCGIAAALMILLSVVVVCQMVLVRYGLRESVYWQTEFVTYLLIAATFVGSPYVLLTRGHVNVELLPVYLGRRARHVLALVAALIALAFCIVVAWTGYRLWHEAWSKGWASDTIWEVRLWIPYLAMPIGFGILSLQYVADILSLVTGREPPFGMSAEEDIS
jgi:TRAP-type C4-dicarboxylate transport system permease small subunit